MITGRKRGFPYPKHTRRPRGGPVVRKLRDDLQSEAAAIIDEATGEPGGAKILKALAVLATGSEEEIAAFFKSPLRLRARDRQAALTVLEQRRFGRVPQFDEQTPDARPVTIVNVFATHEDYAFVTAQRPKLVAPPRQLERRDDGT